MRYYLQTKFCGNLRGSSVFHVDLAWNDPDGSLQLLLSLVRVIYDWVEGPHIAKIAESARKACAMEHAKIFAS